MAIEVKIRVTIAPHLLKILYCGLLEAATNTQIADPMIEKQYMVTVMSILRKGW